MSSTVQSDCSSQTHSPQSASAASSYSTQATSWTRSKCGSSAGSKSSIATYASTTLSRDDRCEKRQLDERLLVPDRLVWPKETCQRYYGPRYPSNKIMQAVRDAQPASSKQFAALFPSSRKLIIHHDDNVVDGNLTLRVDICGELPDGTYEATTLFYMQMHDLRRREFSLRRYSRKSRREVWSSSTAHSNTVRQSNFEGLGAGFKLSLGSLVASLRHKASLTPNQSNPCPQNTPANFRDRHPVSVKESRQVFAEAGIVYLEFSNYARAEVKRSRDATGTPRYKFEYWGDKYKWRQKHTWINGVSGVEYILSRNGSKEAAAHLIPLPQTQAEVAEEQCRDGWIPPYVMWIGDGALTGAASDAADVVVGAGLVALVDHWIRRRFDS